MLGIQDEVLLSQTRRELLAANLLAQARADLSNVDQRISNARQILQPRPTFPCSHFVNQTQVDQAQPEAVAADGLLAQIDRELSEAIQLDATNLAKDAEEMRRKDLLLRRTSVDAIKSAKPSLTGPDPGCSIH
jgi:hypothetical protein